MIEKYVQDNWTSTPLSFENSPVNGDLYEEMVDAKVVLGDGLQKSIDKCVRVVGLLLLTIKVRPDTGITKALQYAGQLALLFVKKNLTPSVPGASPTAEFKVPDLKKGDKVADGWVWVQLSCPFHYDLEIA
jgi:hypothetical protein